MSIDQAFSEFNSVFLALLQVHGAQWVQRQVSSLVLKEYSPDPGGFTGPLPACCFSGTYCTYSLLASQPGRSSFHYSGRPFVKVSRQRAQGRISYVQNEIFISSLPKDTLDMNHKKVIHAKRMENRKTKVAVCVS